MDEADHLGFVERQRRSSGIEEVSEDEPTYTLYSLGGAPCIMAKVDAIFNLEYRTLRHGTQNVKASKGYLFSETTFYLNGNFHSKVLLRKKKSVNMSKYVATFQND